LERGGAGSRAGIAEGGGLPREGGGEKLRAGGVDSRWGGGLERGGGAGSRAGIAEEEGLTRWGCARSRATVDGGGRPCES
jgi:hypothetical protein